MVMMVMIIVSHNNLKGAVSRPSSPICLVFPIICPYLLWNLKWYYDQKITFFSLDFETLFTKHSPSEILSNNFDKKTVYLNCNFPI